MIRLKNILNEKVESGKVICDKCGWEWNISDGGNEPYTCHKCGTINEDLRKWFGKGKTGSTTGGGWDRYNSKGEKVGKCGDSKEGSAYAACLSKEKAAKLGPDGRASFVKRKRAAQSKAGDSKKGNEKSKGQKPTFVKTGASESVNEASKEDIIKDLDKVRNDLIKKVDVLIAKKKKLYSNVDIESPMSVDEKKLNKDIADIFSQIQQLILQKRTIKEGWSQKYKKSINCSNPKGFSQKAHCAGKKKNESMNEVAARYIEPKRVEAFLKKYPKVEDLMQKIVDKVKDVDRGYQIFLHYKNDKGQEQYFGGKKDTKSKSTNVKGLGRTALNKTGKSFNSKTTYNYEWNGKIDTPIWGELFQYVWNKKNENMASKLTLEEKMELFLEKNCPTDSAKWSASKAAAKKKFDVYPSAYANGWAAKNYKSKGGGWKTCK